MMDPYLRPVLISSATVLVLSTLFIIPVDGILFVYFVIGGILSLVFFSKETKNPEPKVFDAIVLGIATGIVIGAILSILIVLKLQDPHQKTLLIEMINKSTKMKSGAEKYLLEDFGAIFSLLISVFTIITSSIFTSFGSLIALPFFGKKRS